MNFVVIDFNGKDSHNSIVQCVSFDNEWTIGFPVCKDWSMSEGVFKKLESILALGRPVPIDTLPGELV